MTSSSTTATFASARTLPSGEGLTLVASLAKGTVAEPSPILQLDTADPGAFLAAGPTVPAVAVFVPISAVALMYLPTVSGAHALPTASTCALPDNASAHRLRTHTAH